MESRIGAHEYARQRRGSFLDVSYALARSNLLAGGRELDARLDRSVIQWGPPRAWAEPHILEKQSVAWLGRRAQLRGLCHSADHRGYDRRQRHIQ